jgi:N-acetyl-alpha-D-muramate 1-phosphate uridylyltransferase
MILAAGRGERMRPLTDHLPKPLVEVRGRALIAHHIEKLAAIGVRRIVINVSYLADTLITAVKSSDNFGCDIVFSVESTALESGGGIATASSNFVGAATVVVSADIYSEFDYQKLLPAIQAIENGHCDAHFVMVKPTHGQPGGEFALNAEERLLMLPLLHNGQPRLTLANIGVLSTKFCQALPRGQRFRLLPHYQDLVDRERATGQLCDAPWWNVTTPDDVKALNLLAVATKE